MNVVSCRKILTSASIPAPSRSVTSGRVRFTPEENPDSLGDSDDYISRLESLQSRLGTLQNGRLDARTRLFWHSCL